MGIQLTFRKLVSVKVYRVAMQTHLHILEHIELVREIIDQIKNFQDNEQERNDLSKSVKSKVVSTPF